MMNFHQKRYLVLAAFFQGLGLTSFSQNMNSPYSVYAIGDIDHRSYNFNSGMGYTGIALKTNLLTNGNNPASVAGIEKRVFMFNAFTAARTVTYYGNTIVASNQTNSDFTIKKLSLSSYITPFWASGIGMRQFSTVNYKFQNTKPIEGSNQTYTLDYSGDGGLNDYYWNNGLNIGKHLSFGVVASFISGPINQTETLVDKSGNTIQTKRRDYYAKGRMEYGAIYSNTFTKKWDFSLGGRFSKRTKLNFDRTITVTENNTPLITDKFIKYSSFDLPTTFGAGLALENKKGTTLAADFSHSVWSPLNVSGYGWQLVSSSRVSVGASFATFIKSYNKLAMNKSFQVGAFIDNSYLKIGARQIMEWGLTTGFTKSLKSGLMLGTSLEGGMRGAREDGLISESYFQINFSFSWRDMLASRKYRFN